MTPGSALESRLGRGFVVLAPPQTGPVPFSHMVGDPWRHERLLRESQKLRGRIYLADGAITEDALADDGRYIQSADDLSWHLLTVTPDDRVTACIRYSSHPSSISFSELDVSQIL